MTFYELATAQVQESGDSEWVRIFASESLEDLHVAFSRYAGQIAGYVRDVADDGADIYAELIDYGITKVRWADNTVNAYRIFQS